MSTAPNCAAARGTAQRECSQAEGLTPARRAALELRLGDARRDLAEAVKARNAHSSLADEYRALADEAADNVHVRVSRNASAIKHRLRAAGLDPHISDCRARVALLEGMLVKGPADVILSAAQCAGMDSTMGALPV